MDWDDLLQQAVNETDASLASKISSLCSLTDEQINSIAPTKIDKDNLFQILNVVKNETLSNEKKAEAIQKIGNSLNILIGLAARVV